jgi:RNA-directed DNA polymerase
LQIAPYRKAKAELKWRFYSFYGEIYRTDVLRTALSEVKENRGAGGVDGLRPEEIQEMEGGEEKWLEEIASELREKRYAASPVRR